MQENSTLCIIWGNQCLQKFKNPAHVEFFLRVKHKIHWSETVWNLIVTCFDCVIRSLNIFTINQWMHKTKIHCKNTCINIYVFINIPRTYSKFNWPEECNISDWSWTAMWPLVSLESITGFLVQIEVFLKWRLHKVPCAHSVERLMKQLNTYSENVIMYSLYFSLLIIIVWIYLQAVSMFKNKTLF